MPATPQIPAYIVVHLGAPDDPSAPNVTVSFLDYIKNVASSEIYPTWPENAIRANIYAQVSYALNRIYTEWYRSRGYNFDITNDTRYDQAFVPDREIFDNISQIVDEIFNDYLVRPGSVEPLFAQYCSGTTVTCDGLSQWGTVPLAEQGMTPYEILTYYYGDDLNIIRDAPITEPIPSYPGTPLRRGSVGNAVRLLQIRLNRISRNYPIIPKIYPVNGVYDINTENAVKAFQRQFNLTPDGIVGAATWYKIAYLYTSVKRLAELDSEGLSLAEIPREFPAVLQQGDVLLAVRILQYYLASVAAFVAEVPFPPLDGVFGPETTASVRAFQQLVGLTPDGIVGEQTWRELVGAYRAIREAIPERLARGGVPAFPGGQLIRGDSGEDVALMQEYLNYIAETFPEIPTVPVTGYYGDQTAAAVIAFQQLFDLAPSGTISIVSWDAIGSVYQDLLQGNEVQPGQFPGIVIGGDG